MPIRVTCGGCGKSLTANEKMAGQTVPCPACKRPLVLPRAAAPAQPASAPAAGGQAQAKPTPSLDSPIDFNLMIEASTPEPEPSAQPQAKRIEGVDWDAIAGKKTAPLAADRPVLTEPAHAESRYNPNDPAAARSPVQGMPEFLRSGALAMVSCVHHLPLIFLLGLVYVAAICALLGLLVGMVALFSGNSDVPRAPVKGLVWVFLGWLIVHLSYFGYVGGYLGEIVLAAKDGRQFTEPPEFNVGRLSKNAVQCFLLALIYVVPLVTLPLAPMAFLTWAAHRDRRAFDVVWVVRTTLRHPLHVLVTLGLSGAFCIVSLVLFHMMAEPVEKLTELLVSKSPVPMDPRVVEFVWDNLVFLVTSPVMFLMCAAIGHVVGLIGRFNPDIFLFMPQKARPTVLLSLGVLPVAMMAMFYVWPSLIIWQAETFGRPCEVVADDGDSDDWDRSVDGTQASNRNPARPDSEPSGNRPATVPRFSTFNEAVGADFAQLNPSEQARRIAGQLVHHEYLRSQLLARLAQFTPDDAARDAVTFALEQMIALERQTSVIQQAALIHTQWGGHADKLLAAQLVSTDDATRKASLFQLFGVEVSSQRATTLVPALRRAATMNSHDKSLQHEAAALLATWSAQPSDAALLLQVFSQDGAERHVALREAVLKLGTEQAIRAIVDKAATPSFDQTAWNMVERLGPAAEPAIINLLSRSSTQTQERAARMLVTIGTKQAIPALRGIAVSRDIGARAAARDALRKIEGDAFDAVTEALLDLSPSLVNDFTAPANAIRLLEKADVDPARRKEVADALIALVESKPLSSQPAARVAGRWGGNEQLPRFEKWIASSSDNLRRCGVAAAGGVGTTEAATLLVPFLTDPQMAFYLQKAIADCGPAAEKPVLKTLQTARDNDVRLACVRMLEKIGTRASLATLIPLAKSRIDFSIPHAAAQAVLAIQKREQSK